MIRKLGFLCWVLLGASGVGLSPAALADVTLKMSVQEMRAKVDFRKLTPAERRNAKALIKDIDRKTLQEETLTLNGTRPTEVTLPNGTRIRATEVSGGEGGVRVHFRVAGKQYSYETEQTIKPRGMAAVNGGRTEKGFLMVTFSRR